MKNEIFPTGYDKEEEYFYNLNRQLIERRRKDIAAAETEAKLAAQRHTHWMKCPKCGHDMLEVQLAGIEVDQCTVCKGIYFDRGELEILRESEEPKGFLSAMRRLFH